MKQWSLVIYLVFVCVLWSGCWYGTPAVSGESLEESVPAESNTAPAEATPEAEISVEATAVPVDDGVPVRMAYMPDLFWNRLDIPESIYADKEAFLTKAEAYAAEIAAFVGDEKWYEHRRLRRLDDVRCYMIFQTTSGVSTANDNIISLRRDLLERGIAPVVHEIVHVICPASTSTSISEGFASYLQDRFSKSITVHNFGLDVNVYAHAIRTDAPDVFDVMFPDIGADVVKSTFEYGESRDYFYILSNSYVRYLVENHGIKDFMTLYRADDLRDAYVTVYGQSMEDMKAAWQSYLEEQPDSMTLEEVESYIWGIIADYGLLPEEDSEE